MARTRQIKPAFFKDDKLGKLEPICRLLLIGLSCLADREGRLERRQERIKAEILLYDDCHIGDLLDELEINGFIECYEVGAGDYIQVVDFGKNQRPHSREVASKIPVRPNVEE